MVNGFRLRRVQPQDLEQVAFIESQATGPQVLGQRF